MIHERLESGKMERDDLFTNLLEANFDEGALTNDELIGTQYCIVAMGSLRPVIGNIFIFLLAGYEVRGAQTSDVLPLKYRCRRLRTRYVLPSHY
jgi:hypothetical protein